VTGRRAGRYDVFVIGGGSAGSEVAFGAARAGLRVGLAESDRLGGECTFTGCVPTKALIRTATLAAEARRADAFGVRIPSVEVDLPAVQARVRSVVERHASGAAPFERAGIDVVPRAARVAGPREVELDDGMRIDADRIVIATGSDPVIPPIPGLADGPVWTNAEAIWSPKEVPASLVVLGAGAIGIEFAQIYARFGAQVTVVEASEQVLPSEDVDAARALTGARSRPLPRSSAPRTMPTGGASRAETGRSTPTRCWSPRGASPQEMCTTSRGLGSRSMRAARRCSISISGRPPPRSGRRATPPEPCCSRMSRTTRPASSSMRSRTGHGRVITGWFPA
jgi:thioredoxin reductase